MRHLFALSLFLLFALSPFPLASQTTGKEFWIAIPPNELLPFPTNELEIYVSSLFDTEIEVFDAAANRTYMRKVKAGEVRTLSDKRGETNWTWEIREFEQVVRKGIRIRSTQPIAVHVLNSKTTTADGCLIFPTSTWDQQYIAITYYDFREYSPWAGGFCIVAKEPTNVMIVLKGTGGSSATTSGGKRLNVDTIRVAMDAGDVYAVKGDGTTRGIFDLTGTSITADRPIGVWGFHERTTMPNLLNNGNGRNHLVEMLPPVKYWGKRYVTTEFRRSGTNPQARGDVFRVVASQPNTRWTMKYYDKQTKAMLGQAGGVLAKSGEFTDLSQSTGPAILTYGYSVWEADKPISVMQYSTSANFDGDNDHDPFMICVVPEEQYVTSSIWQTPTPTKFSTHVLNLIVYADTADPNYIDNLKSLELDDVPVWRHPQSAAPTLLFNHMGRNLHWAQISFGPNAVSHRLTGNVKIKFGGYVYGYGDLDAYGWMIASAARPSSPRDTMPPVLTSTHDCGDVGYEATELRNIPDPVRAVPLDSDQVESGIAEIDTVTGSNSFNYMLILVTDINLPRSPSYKRFAFRWEVIDRSRDAYCEFYVRDWYGNVTTDTIRYSAPELTISPDVINFGELQLGTSDTMAVTITNSSSQPVSLLNATLEIGDYYSIIGKTFPPTFVLQPNASTTVSVRYDARRETNDASADFDHDTMMIFLEECVSYKIGMRGVASRALIDVEDYNAGYHAPGVTLCKPGGLRITNNGSDTLVITGFTGYENSSFTVKPGALTALPYRIAPRSAYVIDNVCYKRSNEDSDSIVARFMSNATGPKDTSIWRGTTKVSSVDEPTLPSASLQLLNGTITASWQGANVSRIIVHDVKGQTIASTDVASGMEQARVSLPPLAHQQLFVTLLSASGTVLHHTVLVAP